MQLEQQTMLELLPDLKKKIVLDLACGSGRYILIAQEQNASIVYGLDLSLEMLSHARGFSTQLIRGDIVSIPIRSASIDVVICGLGIGHVHDLSSAMHEMGRVVRPGGYVIYSDFHPFGKLAGWKRNFRALDGREYAIRHYYHLYGDHHIACLSSGMVIDVIREPLIEGNHDWAGYPGVLVIRARKS